MKTNVREIERRPIVERLDELDLAMMRVLVKDKEQAQRMIQQAQQFVTKVQGSEEFLSKLWAEKYNIEGNFEIDDKGNIKRLPTAVAMEQ